MSKKQESLSKSELATNVLLIYLSKYVSKSDISEIQQIISSVLVLQKKELEQLYVKSQKQVSETKSGCKRKTKSDDIKSSSKSISKSSSKSSQSDATKTTSGVSSKNVKSKQSQIKAHAFQLFSKDVRNDKKMMAKILEKYNKKIDIMNTKSKSMIKHNHVTKLSERNIDYVIDHMWKKIQKNDKSRYEMYLKIAEVSLSRGKNKSEQSDDSDECESDESECESCKSDGSVSDESDCESNGSESDECDSGVSDCDTDVE